MKNLNALIKIYAERIIARIATLMLRSISKDSNIIKRANLEYRHAYGSYEKDDMQKFILEQINDILALLSTQGDSGTSISYKMDILNKIVDGKNLSKLTFSEDEFIEVHPGVFQNKRNSAVFKYSETDRINYLYAIRHKDKYVIKECGEVVETKSNELWSGGLFVVKKNGSVYKLKDIYIKDINKFNEDKFIVNSYEIEYPDGWFISLCKESDLNEFKKVYGYSKDYENIEDEYNYKNGEYRNKLIELVEVAKNHMYNKK